MAGVVGAVVLLIVGLAFVGTRQSDTTAVAAPMTDDTRPPATDPPGTTTTLPPETVPEATATTLKPRRVPTGPPGPLTAAPVDLPGYEKRAGRSSSRSTTSTTPPDHRPGSRWPTSCTRSGWKVPSPGSPLSSTAPTATRSVRCARPGAPTWGSPRSSTPHCSPTREPTDRSRAWSPGRTSSTSAAGAFGGAFYRQGGRPAPHNLFTSTAALYRARGKGAPQRLWNFRGVDDPAGPGAQPTSVASLSFGGGIPVTWTWNPDQKGWARTQNFTPHVDSDGYQVVPQNVIIQYVNYVSSGVHDAAGGLIPEADLFGTGTGVLLTGGAAIPLRWARFTPESRTFFYGPDGDEVRLAPGRTWVELVPTGLGVQLSR